MKADNLRIAKVFSSGGDIHYVLPHFQREYTWDHSNWKTLWDDALAVYEEMQPGAQPEDPYQDVEHFLGSIVVIHDGMRSGTIGAFKLVDGQQRLTTISLLLKALAHRIEESHPHLARKIAKLLVNEDEQGDLFFKILPTSKYNDRGAYCALLGGSPTPPNDSKIPIAFKYFDGVLCEHLETGLSPERLLQVIINAFQVVFVVLDQKESPYKIFESLNAKGKPLTQADLVRNYVAMKLPAIHQERVFTQSWSTIEDLLRETRSVGRLNELTAFLRHYLAMHTGVLCDETHVYARFRDRAEKEFRDPTTFENELVTLARFADHYDKLLRPVRFADDDLATAMKRLNTLEILTGYPFLLRLVDALKNGTLAKGDVLAALTVLENYMVRRYLAGEPQSYLNRMFPLLWNEIDVSHLVESLKAALAARNYPSNIKMLRSLEGRRLYNTTDSTRSRTTLILDTINRKLSEGSGGYTVLDSPPTIEHVMPQTLSEAWKAELGIMWEQVHREYLHTLGNLTLVTAEWNSELSNSAFCEKRARLGENALQLNRSYFVGDLARWGRDEIRERTEALEGMIIDIWPSLLPTDSSPELDTTQPATSLPSEFHFEALERIAKHLGVSLRRLSQSRFESADGNHRLVGVCSKTYTRSETRITYWYGIKKSQRDFLEWQGEAWLAFELATPDRILMFPFRVFNQYFQSLNETVGKHRHVEFVVKGDDVDLLLPLRSERVTVTEYLLPKG